MFKNNLLCTIIDKIGLKASQKRIVIIPAEIRLPAETDKNMLFEGLGLHFFLRQSLFQRDCEYASLSELPFGSLREMERLDPALGLKSPFLPHVTPVADPNPAVSP